jgi:hypothetical protein
MVIGRIRIHSQGEVSDPDPAILYRSKLFIQCVEAPSMKITWFVWKTVLIAKSTDLPAKCLKIPAQVFLKKCVRVSVLRGVRHGYYREMGPGKQFWTIGRSVHDIKFRKRETCRHYSKQTSIFADDSLILPRHFSLRDINISMRYTSLRFASI